MAQDSASLRGFPAFQSFSDADLAAVAEHLEPVTLSQGDVLFRQGDREASVYLVRSGRVEISIDVPEGEDRVVAIMEHGGIFGEVSLLSSGPRTATAEALDPVELWRITRDDFRAALEQGERWAVRLLELIAQVLARRFATLDQELAGLIAASRRSEQQAPVARVAEMEALRKRLFTEWSF